MTSEQIEAAMKIADRLKRLAAEIGVLPNGERRDARIDGFHTNFEALAIVLGRKVLEREHA